MTRSSSVARTTRPGPRNKRDIACPSTTPPGGAPGGPPAANPSALSFKHSLKTHLTRRRSRSLGPRHARSICLPGHWTVNNSAPSLMRLVLHLNHAASRHLVREVPVSLLPCRHCGLRYSWVFTTPVWQLANKMHWTHLTPFAFVVSYFLPIFAVAGFLFGLVPFGKLGNALRELFPSASVQSSPPNRMLVPPILWAWLPVTVAFLIRFATWQSKNSSVFDEHRSPRTYRTLLWSAARPDTRPARQQVDHRPLPLHRPHALSHSLRHRRSAAIPAHGLAQNSTRHGTR